MTSALQILKSYFGRAFLLGVFFPVLIFVGISLILYFEVFQEGLGAALSAWEKLSFQTQLYLVLAGLIVITVLSSLIYNFQYSIIRLFEGYWPRMKWLRKLRANRTELYKCRWEYLKQQMQTNTTLTEAERDEISQELSTFYPASIDNANLFMPTRIGNILRASEIYALNRYGINSISIWTRLSPILENKAMVALEYSRTTLDSMLLMSVLAATFTLIWCPILAIFTNNWVLFLLCALGWPLAWLSYHNAVQRAPDYSEQLKAIFDLYRHDLLKALNRAIPEDAEAERTEWLELSDFFEYNVPLSSKTVFWKKTLTTFAKYFERIRLHKP
jgi:hypothetical protein